MIINVAIDGPAGAGKSTLARAAAKELGYVYVDTGALYRAIGLNALRKNVNTSDTCSVEKTLEGLSVELKFANGEQQVLLNGENVSDSIRTPEASMAASNVSSIPAVRAFLFDLQRDIAASNSCIMDGRDIGTVVLPNAQVKIFLTASPEIRAKRRYDELIAKGSKVNFDDVLEDLKKRDYNDSHRQAAPLKPAADGIIVDTSSLTLRQAADRIIEVIRENIQ